MCRDGWLPRGSVCTEPQPPPCFCTRSFNAQMLKLMKNIDELYRLNFSYSPVATRCSCSSYVLYPLSSQGNKVFLFKIKEDREITLKWVRLPSAAASKFYRLLDTLKKFFFFFLLERLPARTHTQAVNRLSKGTSPICGRSSRWGFSLLTFSQETADGTSCLRCQRNTKTIPPAFICHPYWERCTCMSPNIPFITLGSKEIVIPSITIVVFASFVFANEISWSSLGAFVILSEFGP